MDSNSNLADNVQLPPTVNSDFVKDKLKVITFNCKNIKTCGPFFKDNLENAEIILLQEHWLFTSELQLLNELHSDYIGVGKAVDRDSPLPPVQMPRGYGGVGVLWHRKIDHLVKPIEVGSERIQCVELTVQLVPILLVSVYMPCRGSSDNSMEFTDCVDQLHSIVETYSSTHAVLIGGDINENLIEWSENKRYTTFKDFMLENKLSHTRLGKTFMNSAGEEVSSIDYFIYDEAVKNLNCKFEKMNLCVSSLSDHYPLQCSIHIELNCKQPVKTRECTSRIKWNKIDLNEYKTVVSEKLIDNPEEISSTEGLGEAISNVNKVLQEANEHFVPKRNQHRSAPVLQVASLGMKQASAKNKHTFWKWKKAGRPQEKDNPLFLAMKSSKSALRRECRISLARRRQEYRQQILDTKDRDKSLFYKLLAKKKGKLRNYISELNVDGEIFRTDTEILDGWHKHFSNLATPEFNEGFDSEYMEMVKQDIKQIIDLCKNQKRQDFSVIREDIVKAIASLNRGKSPDIYGLTAEHFQHGGEKLTEHVVNIIHCVVNEGEIPDSLKLGLLTPIFKKKGSNKDSKNYRGITITPVLSKIIELVLRAKIRPVINEVQSPLQRGFTEQSSAMNCALIVEEFLRECKDLNKTAYIAFLDAKSAFDVVSHDSLLRKLFNIGIEGKCWSLINSLHREAISSVKWNGLISRSFRIDQGVRQGGIISTDLYKLYGNKLLCRVDNAGFGASIGGVRCAAPACADDVTMMSDSKEELQRLLYMGYGHSTLEQYVLQPLKSVVLVVEPTKAKLKTSDSNFAWALGGVEMPQVKKTTHMGMMRTGVLSDSLGVESNIQKARRSLYSLMPAGLHGENGLDPESAIHVFQLYVLPVLLYGLEVAVPTKHNLELVERYLRTTLKQILSLPISVATPVIYILSGVLPAEALIHKKVLSLFGNICRLDESSIEKRLAYRQLAVKTYHSNSWFILVKELLIKYSLPTSTDLLKSQLTNSEWKRQFSKSVDSYWVKRLIFETTLYPSLKFLNTKKFQPGKCHQLLKVTSGSDREATRLPVKLKIATGTYILQSNRATFNQNPVKATCLLCNNQDESLDHFLLDCEKLQDVRSPILSDLLHACEVIRQGLDIEVLDTSLLEIIVDSSCLLDIYPSLKSEDIHMVQFHSVRLCYTLHTVRYKRLEIVPRRKKNKPKISVR